MESIGPQPTIGVIFTGGKGLIGRLIRGATRTHIVHVAVDLDGVVLNTTIDGDLYFPRDAYLAATPRVRCCIWVPVDRPLVPFPKDASEEAYPLIPSLIRWLTTIHVEGASDCITRVAEVLGIHGVDVPRRATRTAHRLHDWLLSQGYRHETAFRRGTCRPRAIPAAHLSVAGPGAQRGLEGV